MGYPPAAMSAVFSSAKIQHVMQVNFAYHLNSINAEFTVAVTANVFPGQTANGFDHDATDTYAEIIAATFHSTARHKAEAWGNIPAVILEDMERQAVEIAVERMAKEVEEFDFA